MSWGRRLPLIVALLIAGFVAYDAYREYQHSKTPAGWTVGDVFWVEWVGYAAETDMRIQALLAGSLPEGTTDLESHCDWDVVGANAAHLLANQLRDPPDEIADDLTRSIQAFVDYSRSVCDLLTLDALPGDGRAERESSARDRIEAHRSESFAAAHRVGHTLAEATDDNSPSWWSQHGAEHDRVATTAMRLLNDLAAAIDDTLTGDLDARDRACAEWYSSRNQQRLLSLQAAWNTAPRIIRTVGGAGLLGTVRTVDRMCTEHDPIVQLYPNLDRQVPLATAYWAWSLQIRAGLATLDIFRP